MCLMASVLWSQTWLVVSLGMASVFCFLLVLVIALRVMSFFATPAAQAGGKAGGE